MYKKFLNAILFGALILGSAGTITSCKDYDDEIDEINQKLNNLSSKDELTAQIGQLTGTISAAQAAAAQASTEAANALAAAKEAAAQAEAANQGSGVAAGAAAEAINGAKTAATTAENAAAAAKEAAATAAKASEDAAKAIAAGADANKALADAKKAADAAAATAKEAADAAAAAKKAADDAAKTAGTAAAKAVADAQVAIADAAKKVAEEAAKAAAADAVALEVKGIKERLDALEKGAGSGSGSIDPKDLEEIQKAVEGAKKAVNDLVGKISAAVTSVSIVDSYTAAEVLSSPENLAIYAAQGTWANFYYELQIAYQALTKIKAANATNEDFWLPLSVNSNPLDLDFTAVVEYGDWTAAQNWGKWKAEYENENPFDFYGIGADLKNAITFKKGQQVNKPDYFVVRVSPTNAVITGDMLQLVNSEGKNLNEFVDLEVAPFKGRLSRVTDVVIPEAKTRADGESETGLWIVKATLKTPYDVEKFAELTWFPSDVYIPQRPETETGTDQLAKAITRSTVNLDGENKPENKPVASLINRILYAVQVNNTAEDAEDRYVTSSYDLTLGTSEFQPANRLHYSVNGTRVEKLNNRYDQRSISFLGKDAGLEQEYLERAWLPDTVDVKPGIELNAPKTPADPKQNAAPNNLIYDNVNMAFNVGYANMDWRSREELLRVEPGETFTVTLDQFQGWATVEKQQQTLPIFPGRLDEEKAQGSIVRPTWFTNVKAVPTELAVRAIYVVLDQPNAVESIPSEWNAWMTYNYTGINEIVEGTSVDITVSGEELLSKRGDIIGFRVYAINWDGTLVDPDGRAFYVRIGEAPIEGAVETVIYPNSDEDFDAIEFDPDEVEFPSASDIKTAVENEKWPVSEPEEFAFDAKFLNNKYTATWTAEPIKFTLNKRNDVPQYGNDAETPNSSYWNWEWYSIDDEDKDGIVRKSVPFYPIFLDKDGKVIASFETGINDNQEPSKSISASDWAKVAQVVTVPVIPNWLAYVDDEPYAGALTITDQYGIEIGSVNVTFTKKLPTEAPKGYSIKTNQYFEDGVLKLYLKPDLWTPQPTTQEDSETGLQTLVRNEETGELEGTFALNGTMILTNVFNFGDGSTQDVTSMAKKYTVTFAASDTLFEDQEARMPKPAQVKYTAPAVLLGDSTLTVPAKLIDNKTKHATTVQYNFGKISTKLYDKKTDTFGDYFVTADKFDTEYHDIYDNTYSWSWITLADHNAYAKRYPESGYKNLADATAFSKEYPLKNEIEYGAGSNEPGTAEQYVLDLKYIFGKSTRNVIWNAPMNLPYEGSLVVYDATLNSKANGLEEYFDVLVDVGGTELKFVPLDKDSSINQLANPTDDVESELHIKFIDMYSHEFHEAVVPMKVLSLKQK